MFSPSKRTAAAGENYLKNGGELSAVSEKILNVALRVCSKNAFMDGFREGLRAGFADWRLVTDEMPDERGEYLLTIERGPPGMRTREVCIGWLLSDIKCWHHYIEDEPTVTVIAWARMPHPTEAAT